MLDGSHSKIDHSFTLNNQIFYQLFYLVDGIYLWLAQFLSTIAVPTTVMDSNYLRWQESKRKDIERAFGVIKKKFLCLKYAILLHYKDNIFYLVHACIELHNIMVNI